MIKWIKTIYYFITGWLHYAFFRFTGWTFFPKRFLEKAEGAKECVENGTCVVCGCPTIPMLLSSKPCPKTEIGEKPCF
jgi:hypothetical protein